MFFQGELKQVRRVLPDCRTCGALAHCSHGKLTTPKQSAHTVIVVDAPSEDAPNALTSGDYPTISRMLKRVGRSLDDVTIVPASACHGAEDSWKHCQPLLISELKRLKPTVIIPWGQKPLAAVVDWLWTQPAELPDRWYGFRIPSRELNAWVVPIGRIGHKRNPEVADIWTYRHLKAAFALRTRPYVKVPEYKVKQLYDKDEILEALESAARAELSAFDYETTGLKPENIQHRIVSCGVSWLVGEVPETVAFMVDESLHDALRMYLTSKSFKIAANAKFESRWSRRKLGVEVRNWIWDTMLGAHWEDPRQGITGLKFQAFARLGLGYFAHDVEKYFDTVGANVVNQIHKVPVNQLLKYNGIDAVAELDLGILQMRENGVTERWNSINLPGDGK